MTKPVVGKVVQNIASDNAHTCYANDPVFQRIIDDLCDGDDDVTTALKLTNLLRGRNFALFVVNERLASGDVTEAETAAMRLAAQKAG